MAREGSALIVDSHVHFLDPIARRHAWLDEHPALQRRWSPADYDGSELGVGALVVVQADCLESEALDEVHWIAGLAAQDARIRGIVAYAPLHLGVRAHGWVCTVAREPGVVGVRRLLQDEPQTLLRDPLIADGVRLLGEHGLPFDLCVRHHQLGAVAALVAACPEVTFVLDHLGKPPVAAGELDPWRADLGRLGAHDNVVCKLSGLATEAGPGWRPADVRPYLEYALEVFGPRRCMVGSDWPVLTIGATLEGWFELVMGTVADLSAVERDAVLSGTASSVYRAVAQPKEV